MQNEARTRWREDGLIGGQGIDFNVMILTNFR
jgi:hypothetical protein